VIPAEPPHLPQPFAVHLRPEGARIAEFRVLEDLDEVDELEPAYVARAPYAIWKGLLRGTVDPIEAILRHQLQIQGDVQPLIQRAHFQDIVRRVVDALPTQFADEEGP
jgi:hypothetical protein